MINSHEQNFNMRVAKGIYNLVHNCESKTFVQKYDVRFMRYNLLKEILFLYYHKDLTKINKISFGSNYVH